MSSKSTYIVTRMALAKKDCPQYMGRLRKKRRALKKKQKKARRVRRLRQG